MLITILVICMAGTTFAAVTFTFAPLPDGATPTALNAYMTSVYGSSVTAQSAYVFSGDGFGADSYLTTRPNPGYMDIWFVDPISSVYFEGYVFEATSGADLRYTALDQNNQTVDTAAWDPGSGAGGSYSSGLFSAPVYHLRFSNSGIHDIGIDNLRVEKSQAVPAPGAIALGSFGMLLVNWLKKRKKI